MENKIWLDEIYINILNKMNLVKEKASDKIPYESINGIYDDMKDPNQHGEQGIYWWTNGFWGGILWQLYHATKNERYAEIAVRSEEWLDTALTGYYGLHHDVGFMWLPTAIADYKLKQSLDGKRRGLIAASLLASRFNPQGRFIRAWNGGIDINGWAIIDSMMNIPLLYWATQETKVPNYEQIATLHADTTMKYFIRPDGSCNHIVEFDPLTGDMLKTHKGQGYEKGSSWSRGQAWAIYGFALSYKYTQKQEYLNTAKAVANYFIANITKDGLVALDFRQPAKPWLEDSSAAAIAACGFLELVNYVTDLEKHLYQQSAELLLRTLAEKRSNWTEEEECIIQNFSSAYHTKKHHTTCVYADYFFIEGIFRLKGCAMEIF